MMFGSKDFLQCKPQRCFTLKDLWGCKKQLCFTLKVLLWCKTQLFITFKVSCNTGHSKFFRSNKENRSTCESEKQTITVVCGKNR